MGRKSIDLKCATDPAWVQTIMDNFDAFLADHANCERKASALAMSLIVRFPDRTRIIPELISIAREELQHFEQVYDLMRERGVPLLKDTPDPYVNALIKQMRHGYDDRFMDQLLVSSVVESRGAERFEIIAEALTDEKLKTFYDDLWKAELKHGHQFVAMALEYFEPDPIYLRLDELMTAEAVILGQLEWRASLH